MSLSRALQKHKTPNNYVDGDGIYMEGALALLLRASRCAGVAPIRASRARARWLFHASPTTARLQALVITLLDVFFVTGIALDFCQEPDKRLQAEETFLKAFIWLAERVLVMVIANIAVYTGPAQMECLKRVLEQLQQIYFDLNLNNTPAKFEKIKSFAMVFLLAWMVALVFLDFAFNYQRKANNNIICTCVLCLYISFYIANLQALLVSLRWALTAEAVHGAAAALNHRLQDLYHSTANSTYPMHMLSTVRCLTLTHERISSIMRQMNNTSGLLLMTILNATFFKLVLAPYYMLRYTLNSERNVLFDVTISLNWCLILMVTLVLIIEPCHRTHTERERTEVLLSQLIVHTAPKCNRLFMELDRFVNQVVLSPATFMPLGFYTLDRPLMAMMLSGILCYLVILTEFENLHTNFKST